MDTRVRGNDEFRRDNVLVEKYGWLYLMGF
jgi:hypothetical protein